MDKSNATREVLFNDSLINNVKTLLEQYRDEEMPNWDRPFHYHAEGWSSMGNFMRWLEDKNK